jgi:hypothetical protein
MQEAKRNFIAAMQQLKEEAVEATKSKHNEIFKDWLKGSAVCFKNDSTKMLENYGFQKVCDKTALSGLF